MGLNRVEMERRYFWSSKWDDLKIVFFLFFIASVLVGVGLVLMHLYTLFAPHSGPVSQPILHMPWLLPVMLSLFWIVSHCAAKWRLCQKGVSLIAVVTDNEEQEYSGVIRLYAYSEEDPKRGGVIHVLIGKKSRWWRIRREIWDLEYEKPFWPPEDLSDDSGSRGELFWHYRIRFRGVTRLRVDGGFHDYSDRVVEVREVLSLEGAPAF